MSSSTALDTNAPVAPPPPGAFANMLVGKRRRMRTVSAGQKEIPAGAVASTATKPDKKKTKGKKGKQQEGSCNPNTPANTAIPIFLKSELGSWKALVSKMSILPREIGSIMYRTFS